MTIRACCSRCFLRRVLRLAYSEPNGAGWWFCRACMRRHDRDVTGTRAMASRFTSETP